MMNFQGVDEMQLVSSPFTCSVDSAPTDVQLELIDVQSDSLLKEHFKSASLLEFYSALKLENFPNMRRRSEYVGSLWIHLHM
jgi:17beta-estradiol 17-dehydrogenase/3beta-hydroxysteroid 3-dehydrogenase/mitotic-spindle organizing protein 1